MSEENQEASVEEVNEAPKAPKLKKKVEGVSKEAVVNVLAESNPKREGSKAYERFDKYFGLAEGTTVAGAIEAGLTMGDIHYDIIHGNISVDGAEVFEYAPTPRGKKSVAIEDDTAVESEVDTDEAEVDGY